MIQHHYQDVVQDCVRGLVGNHYIVCGWYHCVVPLVNEEHPCPRQSGVGGVCQLAHSGVVYEPSDEEHEA